MSAVADMERQRRYDRTFAEVYGKAKDELTDSERASPGVFWAHEETVRRLDGAPAADGALYRNAMTALRQAQERHEARTRRLDRLENVVLFVLLIACIVAAAARLL